MSQAVSANTTPTSRRALLASGAAAILGGTTAGAIASASTSIGDLAERFRIAWIKEMQEDDAADYSEERFHAAYHRTRALALEIEALTGTGMDVLGLKALAYLWCGHGEILEAKDARVLDDGVYREACTDERLCSAIRRDLKLISAA